MSYNGETLGLGQTSEVERMYIYYVVKSMDNPIVIECGTLEGGGTTYAIVNALKENKENEGSLFTWEIEKYRFDIACSKYSKLDPIKLYNESFEIGINNYENNSVDMVLFDNVNDPDLNEILFYKIFDVLKIDGNLIIHDWLTDYNHLFLKKFNKKLIDYLEQNWKLEKIITTSTGLAHFIKIKN